MDFDPRESNFPMFAYTTHVAGTETIRVGLDEHGELEFYLDDRIVEWLEEFHINYFLATANRNLD